MVWQRHTGWSLAGAVRRSNVHDGIVKEVFALELLRREKVRFAVKLAYKRGPRHLSVAVDAPVLAFHRRHQRQQTIAVFRSDLFLNSFHKDFGVALRLP